MTRLIDADALLNEIKNAQDKLKSDNDTIWEMNKGYFKGLAWANRIIIDAPPVELDESVIQEVLNKRYMTAVANEYLIELHGKRTQGECRTCKYYRPYFEQFSREPRGDGYCSIARMTPEGMTTINCDDDFCCSDYQKGGTENANSN